MELIDVMKKKIRNAVNNIFFKGTIFEMEQIDLLERRRFRYGVNDLNSRGGQHAEQK